MHRDAQLILVAGGLLAAGVAASLIAARIRVPALVLFLGLGLAIGSDGLGWIDFDDYGFARLIGSIALLLILYEGGLAAGFWAVRPVLATALSLAIFGTIITALIAGLSAALLFDFSVKEGLLLGAILSATDGAAVFALMRGLRVPARLARTLEGEAGLNDPIAVLLVLVMIKLIQHASYGAAAVSWFFVRELAVGAIVGTGMGWLTGRLLRRAHFAPPALSLVASLAAAAVAFGAAALLEGSGFLAVYLAGLTLGAMRLEERPALLAFHEGLASVAEIGLFLALGLLVFPSQLGGVAWKGILLALIIALLARPIAVAVSTVRSGFSPGERVVLSWAGLRGAIPVVLATFAVIAEIPRSLHFFNIVFFAVLVSTVVQGSTVAWLARRLGVIAREPSWAAARRA
jgi:cell volume regulation protein A